MCQIRALMWPILNLEQKANTCTPSITSRDTFWLALDNLITVMEDLQVNLICAVGGLCICLVTYFLPCRTVTALLNVEPLKSLTFTKIKLYL